MYKHNQHVVADIFTGLLCSVTDCSHIAKSNLHGKLTLLAQASPLHQDLIRYLNTMHRFYSSDRNPAEITPAFTPGNNVHQDHIHPSATVAMQLHLHHQTPHAHFHLLSGAAGHLLHAHISDKQLAP